MERREEIRELNRLDEKEIVRSCGDRLVVLESLDELHRHFAEAILEVIATNNEAGKPTVLILPYGPVGQYPLLLDLINSQRVSLAESIVFFMDEYADDEGKAVSSSHPLSFRGQLEWFWEKIAPDLRPGMENIIFPSEENAAGLSSWIEKAGGIEVCFGGIGIHGHLAFNEPAEGVRNSGPRLVTLNDFTITMNAIRSGVGGDLENFPRKAWTLGLEDCLKARKVRLYCRNDIAGLEWANTVLRLALLGAPGDDYPVTWVRHHPDWQIITDRNTLERPTHLLPDLCGTR